MTEETVVLLTGSNRGVGLALAQLLARTASVPICLICTSRTGHPMRAILDAATPTCRVMFVRLDLTRPGSIKQLADSVRAAHSRLDVLINMAGSNEDHGNPYTPETARRSLALNFEGTRDMCLAFLPLMRKGGRIINMSSAASQNPVFPAALHDRWEAPDLTLPQLEALLSEYEAAVAHPTKDDGWPHNAPIPTYTMAKIGINHMTRILARDHPHLLINCACPGSCDTEMGRMVPHAPAKTAAEGAKIPYKLALGDIHGVSGEYWANRLMSSSADGEVLVWQGLGAKVWE